MAVTFLLCVGIGMLLGFLAGIGVGGGSLLVLWLTVALGTAPAQARCMNLLFFIPCALCASILRWRQGALNFKKLLPPIVLGCISAGFFSWIGNSMDTRLLKKILGLLLLCTGIREVCYRPKS